MEDIEVTLFLNLFLYRKTLKDPLPHSLIKRELERSAAPVVEPFAVGWQTYFGEEAVQIIVIFLPVIFHI